MDDSQISKQHPIPQNFMDVEFKIVGDFTVRQFTYLVLFGFPMYAIFQSPTQGFIKTVVLTILGILGFLLVFVPIDDRGMDVWIVNFFKAVYANNRRVWRKTPFIPKTLSMESIKLVQGEMITLAPTASRRKLEDYLKGIKAEEADDYDFNFAKFKYSYIETQAPETTIQTLAPIIEEPSFQPAPKPSTIQPTKIESASISMNQVLDIFNQPIESGVVSKEAIKETFKQPEIPKVEPVKEVVLKLPEIIKAQPAPKITATPVFQIPKVVIPTIKKILPQKPQTQLVSQKPISDINEEFRVSEVGIPGRKFVSFAPQEHELILPVRGERVLNLFNRPSPTPSGNGKDVGTIARELRTLVREIKNELPSEETQSITKPTSSPETVSPNFISGIVFDSENNSLANVTLVLIDSYGNEIKFSRTDKAGKFIFKGTESGNFKIKVLNPEIFNLNFDIINLSVERYPYPLIQILGKK